jgi:hypothetical protein
MGRMLTHLQVTRHRDMHNHTHNKLILLKDTLLPMPNPHLDSKIAALPSWKDGKPPSQPLSHTHTYIHNLITLSL